MHTNQLINLNKEEIKKKANNSSITTKAISVTNFIRTIFVYVATSILAVVGYILFSYLHLKKKNHETGYQLEIGQKHKKYV